MPRVFLFLKKKIKKITQTKNKSTSHPFIHLEIVQLKDISVKIATVLLSEAMDSLAIKLVKRLFFCFLSVS